MKRILVALGAVAILALGLWACSGGGQQQQQQQATPPAEQQATVDQMNKRIAAVEGTMDSLKTAAEKMVRKPRTRLRRLLRRSSPGWRT